MRNATDGEAFRDHAPVYFYSLYFVPLWVVIGSIGNVLSFLVWVSPRVRKENSSAVYLAALSLVDFFLLNFTFLIKLHILWPSITPVFNHPFICEAYSTPNVATQYMSHLLVLSFSVERWIAICFPFRQDSMCTTRRACFVVVGLAVLSLALSAIHAFLFRFKNGDCTTVKHLYDVMPYYNLAVELLMAGGVPILTLICNIRVIIELRRIERRNRILSGGRSSVSTSLMDEGRSSSRTNFKATTAMLLCVSFYLIFTALPEGICYTVQFIVGYPDEDWDGDYHPFFTLASVKGVVDQLMLSHYACNFFIYCFTGKLFRRHLTRHVLRCRFLFRSNNTTFYSAVRHSVATDHTRLNGNDHVVARGDGGDFPFPRAGRRQSGRSASSGGTAGATKEPMTLEHHL